MAYWYTDFHTVKGGLSALGPHNVHLYYSPIQCSISFSFVNLSKSWTGAIVPPFKFFISK